MAKWLLRQTSIDIERMAHQTGLDPVLVRLLAVRGHKDGEEMTAFLAPEKTKLADPLLFADMDAAVARINRALDNEERFIIFGDYDADGIMSTVILTRTFEELGVTVPYYIPKRDGEGYGLNDDAVQALADQGFTLILACDNGISAFDQVELAKKLGIDVVVLDHHAITLDSEGKQVLPQAAAVVDAKRQDCAYPFKSYCAAALCYRFSEQLFRSRGEEWKELKRELLPFVTVATVCDIVELVGENRTLVKFGLRCLESTTNCGLQALIAAVNVKFPLDTYHVGYILGPCINAAGRMGEVDLAVSLFLTDDPEEAAELAEELVMLNLKRRKLTEAGTALVFQRIESQKLHEDKIIVVHAPEINESIAGIIAGRVKEKFYHPTIVLGGNDDLLRGSGRSIEGYNIFDGLSEVKDLFPSYGGHALAAGLSVYKTDVEQLRRRLNANCTLTEADFQEPIRIDFALPLEKADIALARRLKLLQPFGKANEEPLFADKGIQLLRVDELGKNGKVIRWMIRSRSGELHEAIDFRGREALEAYVTEQLGPSGWEMLTKGSVNKNEPKLLFDVIYKLSCSTFGNQEKERLEISHFRPSAKSAAHAGVQR